MGDQTKPPSGSILTRVKAGTTTSKTVFIIAVGETGCGFDPVRPLRHRILTLISIRVDSMKELAEQFVEEGLFGEIPARLARLHRHGRHRPRSGYGLHRNRGRRGTADLSGGLIARFPTAVEKMDKC